MRINALQGLCGQPGGLGGPSPVYASLRRMALTDSRGFGRFSLRDIDIAEGIIPPPAGMDHLPDTSTIGAAFQDSPADVLSATLAAVRQARADVKAISGVFDMNTPGQGPEYDELIKLLNNIARRMTGYASISDTAGEADGDAPAAAAPSVPGAINSTGDVTAALERIIAYYKRHEPSSPIPILLERAKRLVNADFLTIIKDMAPHGLDNVQTVGGLEDDDD